MIEITASNSLKYKSAVKKRYDKEKFSNIYNLKKRGTWSPISNLNGKNILISAHGNSLRALCKYLFNISDIKNFLYGEKTKLGTEVLLQERKSFDEDSGRGQAGGGFRKIRFNQSGGGDPGNEKNNKEVVIIEIKNFIFPPKIFFNH